MQPFSSPPQDRSRGLSYQRLLPLGTGGMANVHLALALGQGGFKRLVVVKSVREDLLENTAMRHMFLEEARLSARLNHPNVVQVSEVLEAEETVTIVMEYLDGLSLAASYTALGAAFTLPMRLRIVSEVLVGLHHAHEFVDYDGNPLGIVHRDVSPQNVFLTYDGRVKLLDFGIAKMTASPDRTRTGVVKGRVAYMPFEQVSGGNVDRRTDVFATGVVLWEAVAASRLWDKLTEAQIARRLLRGEIPRLGARVEVDPEIERIVNKATAHLPEQRYATAEEMRLELEGYLSRFPPVDLRQVGELLSSASDEARAKRQEDIAQSIAAVERDTSISHIEVNPAWVRGTTATSSSSGARTIPDGSLATSSSFAARPGGRRRGVRRGLAALLVLATIAGGAAFGALALRRDALPGAASPAPAAPSQWVLTVNAEPSDARVTINGDEASGNPAILRVAAGRTQLVRVERAGYRTVEQSLRVERDTSLRITLAHEAAEDTAAKQPIATPEAVPERAPSRAARVRPTPKASARAASPAAQRAGCQPPYYFVDGIKTYKPECI